MKMRQKRSRETDQLRPTDSGKYSLRRKARSGQKAVWATRRPGNGSLKCGGSLQGWLQTRQTYLGKISQCIWHRSYMKAVYTSMLCPRPRPSIPQYEHNKTVWIQHRRSVYLPFHCFLHFRTTNFPHNPFKEFWLPQALSTRAQINSLARICGILESLQLLWVTVTVSSLAVSTQRLVIMLLAVKETRICSPEICYFGIRNLLSRRVIEKKQIEEKSPPLPHVPKSRT